MVDEKIRPSQIKFTDAGNDKWRCDLCGKEVRGRRGVGGHKGAHTGKASAWRSRFATRTELAAAPVAQRGRFAMVRRTTGETNVNATITLDGTGKAACRTGVGFLNHMIAQIARHGLLDITVQAESKDGSSHHVVEDVAIVLGRALREALGDGAGLTRMGDATVPLDEALAMCAVDLSGRPYAVINTDLHGQDVEGLPGDMIDHFLETFALEARIGLHCRVLYGRNAHHKAEALFKALARSLRVAVVVDPRLGGAAPSTKGKIG